MKYTEQQVPENKKGSLNPLKILVVYGTRPEAIKLAPIVLELRALSDFETKVCVTAQHREMLDQINSFFGIVPDFDLNSMHSNQDLHQLTALILSNVNSIIRKVSPDWILVQGDTTTAMAASLAGYYEKTKVAHIEAGLRSGDKWEPFPEETNRKIISAIADLHFAPTAQARQNLLNEGVLDEKILISGNTIVDTMKLIDQMNFDLADSPVRNIPWHRKVILVTAHRRENWGKPLENICEAIKILTTRHKGIQFAIPLHINPVVQDTIVSIVGDNPMVTLLPPLDYQDMLYLLKKCLFVMTDSGGIQEEAPSFGKAIMVLRNNTERPEGIVEGFAKLVGTDTNKIVEEASILIDKSDERGSATLVKNPYGDGLATERIVDTLRKLS